MKHHVILLRETPILTGTYNITEFNLTDEEVFPIPGLVDALKGCTFKEIIDELTVRHAFIDRQNFIEQPDENGKTVQVPIGQSSLIELALAGTTIVTMFFFNIHGLPSHQTVYDMRIEEK